MRKYRSGGLKMEKRNDALSKLRKWGIEQPVKKKIDNPLLESEAKVKLLFDISSLVYREANVIQLKKILEEKFLDLKGEGQYEKLYMMGKFIREMEEGMDKKDIKLAVKMAAWDLSKKGGIGYNARDIQDEMVRIKEFLKDE